MSDELALSICVQHHPSRAHLLQSLLERLPGLEIVTDPDPDGKPNPLRTYLECLRQTPEFATHRLILQDDCWPCRDLRVKAEVALTERPDSIVLFFVPGSPGGGMNSVLRAAKDQERWALIGAGGWVPVVATAWPSTLIPDFLEFAKQRRFARLRSDDELVKRYVGTKRLPVWATVPSLVEHPDVVPSLIGRKHGAGSIKWRVAAMFDEG